MTVCIILTCITHTKFIVYNFTCINLKLFTNRLCLCAPVNGRQFPFDCRNYFLLFCLCVSVEIRAVVVARITSDPFCKWNLPYSVATPSGWSSTRSRTSCTATVCSTLSWRNTFVCGTRWSSWETSSPPRWVHLVSYGLSGFTWLLMASVGSLSFFLRPRWVHLTSYGLSGFTWLLTASVGSLNFLRPQWVHLTSYGLSGVT